MLLICKQGENPQVTKKLKIKLLQKTVRKSYSYKNPSINSQCYIKQGGNHTITYKPGENHHLTKNLGKNHTVTKKTMRKSNYYKKAVKKSHCYKKLWSHCY